MKKNKQAFSLIETMVAILIVSIVLISWFQLFSMASVSKIKLEEQTKLEKNIFYFSEKLFTLIKNGWVLDYEEYFNRKVVWTELENWHYKKLTWFWNFWFNWDLEWNTQNYWKGFYFCLSSLNSKIDTTKWCVDNHNTDSLKKWWNSRNYSWIPQRYWQYSYQFIDYNSNFDSDNWDENWDWKIIKDDDDEHMWKGPEVFEAGKNVNELYLISWDKKTRTFFRWKIIQDEFSKEKKCIVSTENWKIIPNQNCRWTIEYLQLEGKDWWEDHNWFSGKFLNDWVIDTWLVSSNFSWLDNISLQQRAVIWWTEKADKYWKPLFPDDINISRFEVKAYPNIDSSKVWNEDSQKQNNYLVSPYVIISVKIEPSNKVKSKIKWNIKPIEFSTTINLTTIFSN